METSIEKIMDSEDKKNPYTDDEIAKQMGISREIVTQYRKLNKIPDSRQRRREIILKDAWEIMKKDSNISDRAFTRELNDRGYKLSRYTAVEIKREAAELLEDSAEIVDEDNYIKSQENVISEKDNLEKTNDAFDCIIGKEGSLKLQINQAKAAILYPPRGLHTLLLGPSGVGKSYMAEVMYNFARTTKNFSSNAPFAVFNCADYADNPQLLLSQLFGHVKGAFTGAGEGKKGMVELCDGGILFLDEIHRLPSEGQEILFYLIDRGKFRRLGETELTRESKLMIIAATTESPEGSLLLTFRRRIPMIIEIPSINDRSYRERFEIIKNFFLNESIRLGKDILVARDVIKSFMIYDCPGNIGQLKSDIQVCCAKGFLHSTLNNKEKVKVNFKDVPDYVKEQVLNSNIKDRELEKYTYEDIIVSSKGIEVLRKEQYNSVDKDNIYLFIEEKYRRLKEEGHSDRDINKIIGSQVEEELVRFASAVKFSSTDIQELVDIVGKDILSIIEDIFGLIKENIPGIQRKVIYPLAIHLKSAYDRVLNTHKIVNPNLEMVKKEYRKEYNVSSKITKLIGDRLNVNFPEDEIAFIAMYLKHFQHKNKLQVHGRVGVIVLSHGRVASGMAEVANRLLGVKHAVGLEMELSDSPNIMLEKTIKLVKKVDEGKGCILLVDMGSLTTFGDIITGKTGIPTRVIGRVDTLMVLECVRRALLPEDTLDSIADEIDNKNYISRGLNIDTKNKAKAIVTLCITGEGAAEKVKEYMENYLEDSVKDIDIIPLGYMNNENVNTTIDRIGKNKEILAIVGTINPEIKDIPFISVENVVTGTALNTLNRLINKKDILKNRLSNIIPEEFIFPQENYKYKDEILDNMTKRLIEADYVDEGFLLSVYKREALGATYLKGGIAIPHGDSKFVTKPTIAVTKLATPINWDGVNNVDLIFMIALKEDSKDYFEQLYRVISASESLSKIREAKNKKEIMDILFENTILAI
ncbi:sigma 54-interacting transcriptional regulator [Clostridium pasteurianum]|uniref:Transcriptional antiterminator n=1 Tax=Clostridium pasteurianum BC1 TaxID=86416 RepID=R4K1T7_CLOPA|nr:sigma 54-interacting transcriptional regulator [Clostridium pasteurianum]AGK95751.1 transcriptional antiterminator [Clostridium pasteurianum BC1]